MVASTATTIGVELGTNAGTGAPTSVLGYRRAELAFVPTNRKQGGGTEGGVKEVANVLMELRYGADGSQLGGVYQRLAVGTEAVQTAGATLMFGKQADGTVSPSLAAAAAQGRATVKTTDALIECFSAGDKVKRTALGKLLDRASAESAANSVIEPYRSSLVASNKTQLRALLLTSDELSAALAKHRTDADCQTTE